MTAQIISKREFWNALVAKAIQKFDFGISSADQLVSDLVRLGWDEDEAVGLVFDEE